MNTNKTIILAIGIAVILSSQLCTGMEQLDDKGKAIINVLTTLHNTLINTAQKSQTPVKFNFETWDDVLNNEVKKYVKDNSRVEGIEDPTLIHYLGVLIHGSANLQTAIRRVQDHKKPLNPLSETEVHVLSENLLKPFERLEQNIKNILIPKIASLSFKTYVNEKKKAQAMLINVFRLLQQMAEAMAKHTAALLYSDLK